MVSILEHHSIAPAREEAMVLPTERIPLKLGEGRRNELFSA